jgi:hypothetical protein
LTEASNFAASNAIAQHDQGFIIPRRAADLEVSARTIDLLSQVASPWVPFVVSRTT